MHAYMYVRMYMYACTCMYVACMPLYACMHACIATVFPTRQEQCLSETTCQHLVRSTFMSQSNAFSTHQEKKCYFELSTSEWDCVLSQDCINPSWVHVMATGLSKLNSCCSVAFRRHWKKILHSQKPGSIIFKADGYCTFSTCKVKIHLYVNNSSFQANSVRVFVEFSGKINHPSGETHARKISKSVRERAVSLFQEHKVAPSKLYHSKLSQLSSHKYAAGNRDGVGCSVTVLQKISSEARLQLEEDRNLIVSLMSLQKHFCAAELCITNSETHRKASPIEGFIQYIHAMPFSVICFNQAAVRLYHDIARRSPIFCDATGTIVSLPKDSTNYKPTLYYYALVVKHPVPQKPPIAVAELITADHTVLSISFFLQSFRRAESVLFGSANLAKPGKIIIDRSMVLLLSFLQVYNMENLHDYLNRTFRVVTGAATLKDSQKVSPHACKSHVMNSAKRECKKW